MIFYLIVIFIGYTLCTQCIDGSYCPGFQTCCLTRYGVGCCPYRDANCCGDGVNCCPNGYKCYGGGCYRDTNNNSTLFGLDVILTNATSLTPALKNNQGPKLFEIIRCAEDLRPFAKEIRQALQDLDIYDIDSLINLSEKLMNLNKANNMFNECFSKLQSLIFEYFN